MGGTTWLSSSPCSVQIKKFNSSLDRSLSRFDVLPAVHRLFDRVKLAPGPHREFDERVFACSAVWEELYVVGLVIEVSFLLCEFVDEAFHVVEVVVGLLFQAAALGHALCAQRRVNFV